MIIRIENLVKYYDKLKAVDNVSFSVERGEMFGLVGPDGAGKTTIIRILCGLINATEGSLFMLGKNIKSEMPELRNSIGYLSQKFSLYGDLSVDENIEFFADIHGVKNYKERRDELLEFTRLKPFRKRLADRLSGGMKQKLALGCSLIHKPKIIFLDEPTTGVDPVSRRDFWKILSELQNEGVTVFLTTPYMDEAERCNRVALMNKGKIISLDTPKNIKTAINKSVIEIICSPVREAYKLISEKLKIEVQIYGDRLNIVTENAGIDLPAIENVLESSSLKVIDKRIIPPSLENVFIYLVKNNY
ncbi:MAG TPA: ABC transporter ATP-binding protein [Ignavibacteriaceae bacterium]|nr:ABC transporter ATP-binding protein [Ignavibacteriaceae bacterium]